ncbi:MAG: anti-sigma factor [Acidobacteriota bacterium]
MNEQIEETMLDLLCKKATYGLNPQEEKQLADLEREMGREGESESFELTAAALSMAHLDTSQAMPANLQSRILAEAERYFDKTPESRASSVSAFVSDSDEAPSGSLFNWLGWAVAAAACLALALNIFYTRPQSTIVQGNFPTPTPEERLTPSQMRQRLIDSAPDLARADWGAGNVKELTPSGDIVWSDAKQAGYMRLSGLPVNDPNKETYQLWIFDETQDDKTPIDGGTFTVNSVGEVIIPINAKLPPKNTKMYAITVEIPGGVVVSKREKIVALAKRET